MPRWELEADARFFSYVKYTDECWEWNGHTHKQGYGFFRYKGVNIMAHRWSYEYFREPLNKFWCLHHCDNPSCVNPFHLFAGTHLDNMRDLIYKGRHCNQKKTHCIRGHEFNKENTLMSGTKRKCRACVKAYHKKRYAAKIKGDSDVK